MCERHFRPEDIRWETSVFDEKTGNRITAKLEKPRHVCGAVPCLLPNCPAYLSTYTNSREAPDKRRSRLEETAIRAAIVQSVADDAQYRQKREFENLEQLENKLGFLDKDYWNVIKQDGSLLFCHIDTSPSPKIQLSVIVDQNCKAQAFVQEVKLQTLGKYKIPEYIKDINTLEELLCKLKCCDKEGGHVSSQKTIFVLQLVISFLNLIKDESFKYFHGLTFICEQIHLMTLNRLEYSSETLIFSSLFYNCSPQGYRLLRNSKYILLPCYSTLKRLTLSRNMNPAAEQHDANFFVIY